VSDELDLLEQLEAVLAFADHSGCIDAAEWIRRHIEEWSS
jgi:hypothetical protein